MVNAQYWLSQNYPKHKRNSIKEINISQQNLVGALKLEGFSNLEILDCSHNNLISLDLTKNNHLKEINCSHNDLSGLVLGDNLFLTSLDCSINNLSNIEFIISLLHPEKLVYLNLRNNCFSPSKLTVFSPFSQLKELYLGTSDLTRVVSLKFNQFYGSVKPLQNCQKLEVLCFNNTEVNYGWEYLPNSLEQIFLADVREKLTGEDLGHAKILAELALFDGDFNRWRSEKILKSEQLPQLIKERDTFKRLTDFWKEKYENSRTCQVDNSGKDFALKIQQDLHEEKKEMAKEIAELKISLATAKNKIKELQTENHDYQEANTLIKEKYERIMNENPQLRNEQLKILLMDSEEKSQAHVQINFQQNK